MSLGNIFCSAGYLQGVYVKIFLTKMVRVFIGAFWQVNFPSNISRNKNVFSTERIIV